MVICPFVSMLPPNELPALYPEPVDCCAGVWSTSVPTNTFAPFAVAVDFLAVIRKAAIPHIVLASADTSSPVDTIMSGVHVCATEVTLPLDCEGIGRRCGGTIPNYKCVCATSLRVTRVLDIVFANSSLRPSRCMCCKVLSMSILTPCNCAVSFCMGGVGSCCRKIPFCMGTGGSSTGLSLPPL